MIVNTDPRIAMIDLDFGIMSKTGIRTDIPGAEGHLRQGANPIDPFRQFAKPILIRILGLVIATVVDHVQDPMNVIATVAGRVQDPMNDIMMEMTAPSKVIFTTLQLKNDS